MKVGILRINLRLPENSSLKGKRQILKPITAQLKNRFNVSVAEVDGNDLWQRASLGVCCVSNDGSHVDEMLSRVMNFVSGGQFDIEILGSEIEIISF